MRRITTSLEDLNDGFFNYVKDATITLGAIKYVLDYVNKNWNEDLEAKIKSNQAASLTVRVPEYILPAVHENIVPVTLEEGGVHHLMYDPSEFIITSRDNRPWLSVTIPSHKTHGRKTSDITIVFVNDPIVVNAMKVIAIYPGMAAGPEPDAIINWQSKRSPPPDLETSKRFWLTPEEVRNKQKEFSTEKWVCVYDENSEDTHNDDNVTKSSLPAYVVRQISVVVKNILNIKKVVSTELNKLPSNLFEVISDEKSIFSCINKIERKFQTGAISNKDLRTKPITDIIGDIIRFSILPKKKANYTKSIEKIFNVLRRISIKLDGQINIDEKVSSLKNPYGGTSAIKIIHVDIVTPILKIEFQIYPSSFKSFKEYMHKFLDKQKEEIIQGKKISVPDRSMHESVVKFLNNYSIKPSGRNKKDRRPKNRKRIDIDAKNVLHLSSIFLKLASNVEFLVMVKPNGMSHIDKVIELINSSGGKILDSKRIIVDSRLISQHYKQFVGKSFFVPMLKYFVGREVQLFKVSGTNETIRNIRLAIGDAKPTDPNSFRFKITGDTWRDTIKEFGVLDNGIHVSDSISEGQREVNIWFGYPEIYQIHDDEYHNKIVGIHRSIMDALYKLQRINPEVVSIQYSATNNETAVKDKPFDLDYRVLTTTDVDYVAKQLCQIYPDAVWDRVGKDERTGSRYIKLEVNFENGKADIAIVPADEYKNRIGSGHLADVMSTGWKIEAGKRKTEAWQAAKIVLDKINALKRSGQDVPNELLLEYKDAKKKYDTVKNKLRAEVLEFFGLEVPEHIK